MMRFTKYITVSMLAIMMMACKDEPKVITAQSDSASTETQSSGIFTDESKTVEPMNQGGFTENLHTVVAKKVLPTDKYVYINVTEGGKDFWIATGKMDVTVGNTYFYRGGLLKTNFESKEYQRVFDSIYLVSSVVARDHAEHTGGLKADFEEEGKTQTFSSTKQQNIPTHTEEVVEHKGSIKIAELVANPSAYEGKTVQLTGKVVKVNPNIMNRNWLHIQDGSKDNYDLVVTSNAYVPEGTTITIRAKVSLDRDFGAGYRYDLILEEGTLVE